MRRTTLLPALALALCLTACGGGDRDAQESLLSRAAGMDPAVRLLTVDRRDVEARRCLYHLACACDRIAAHYAAQGGAPDWAEPLDGGRTLGDYAREQALQTAVLYATVENWAEQYGCTLTEADRAAMDEAWAARAAEYGGEAAYLAALARLGLDRSGAEELAAVSCLYRHLCALAAAPDSPLSPTDAEAADCAAAQGLVSASWLCIPPDGDRARRRADEAFAALNADPAGDFQALAEQYGGAHAAAFTPGDGTLPAACESAVLALQPGQWSGIVSAESGFYILLRRAPDRESVAVCWLDRRLQDAADRAEVRVTRAYQTLRVEKFYAALTRERAALPAEDSRSSP